jgi:hypothetical protein
LIENYLYILCIYYEVFHIKVILKDFNKCDKYLMFYMLQVPTYQKPRVFVPLNYPPRPPLDGNASTSDPKQRPVAGPPVMPNATQLSGTTVDGMFDGKRIRKTMVRKTVDYNTSVVKYLEVLTSFILM